MTSKNKILSVVHSTNMTYHNVFSNMLSIAESLTVILCDHSTVCFTCDFFIKSSDYSETLKVDDPKWSVQSGQTKMDGIDPLDFYFLAPSIFNSY